MTKGCRRCIWLKFLTAWAEEAFRIHQPHLKLFICFFRIHTSETWSCNCVTQNFLSPVAVEAVLIIWECAFCPMPQSHPLPPYSYDLIEMLSPGTMHHTMQCWVSSTTICPWSQVRFFVQSKKPDMHSQDSQVHPTQAATTLKMCGKARFLAKPSCHPEGHSVESSSCACQVISARTIALQ